jgi:peptidoglycan L-alanyl-D-glutamate endopeptidase CwlK
MTGVALNRIFILTAWLCVWQPRFLFAQNAAPLHENILIDSNLTLAEAVVGSSAPADVLAVQMLVTVRYYGFDGRLHQGQAVVHQDAAEDIKAIFREIEASRFPISKVVPIVVYHWSDSLSMADNNSSAFNYRTPFGQVRLSAHANGTAMDLNPMQNPCITGSGGVLPRGVKRNVAAVGTLTDTSAAVKAFRKRGWLWGGLWRRSKDYQHFEKKPR